MHVPLLDLKLQYQPLRDEIERAVRDICDSQQFVLGAPVARLEREIADYSQAGYAVGVSSGTDALLLALMALGIQAGDEVVTTPFTFFATAGVIARVGARPIFCDIEFPSFNLSADAVEDFIESECDRAGDALINRRTGGTIKGLMPVHLYGQMADMHRFESIARRYGLALIEDAAQAIGAELADGRRAGSIGDVGCFSFFPTKNLGAFGDAGMCVTSDEATAQRMSALRVHGGERRYFHAMIGGNFRLDAIQAAVLSIKLKSLDQWTERRQANAATYDRLLTETGASSHVTLPANASGGRHIFNQYVIRCPRRDDLKRHLSQRDIGSEVYYPLALHQQECFAYLGYEAGALPNSTAAALDVLALPIYPELTPEQLEYVAASVAEFFGC